MLKKSISFLILIFLSSQMFCATMNSRVRQVPKNIQEQVFITPKETLPQLVNFLVGTSGDTSSRVKILHDWICDNISYDCNAFTNEGAGKQDYESVLKKEKAVCVGYCNLMAAMCYYAKIEVDIISGWPKGFNYPGYLYKESDHAWNIVKIGGKWKQIDVTWDAGYVDKRSFIKRYTLQWFNLSPSQFIYSHLPEEEKWQLLPEKLIRTPEQFVKEPYIPGIFFEYGLSFGKNAHEYTNEISEATGFDIVCSKPNVMMMASIYGRDAPSDMDSASWFENAGSTRRFIFDVPDKKIYSTQFGARFSGTTTNPKFFNKSDFEQNILAKLPSLVSSKKITPKEAELFEKSYCLIEENNRYYYAEDLFDNPRNLANNKILKLLDRNTHNYETVLNFDIKAASDYDGFGKNVLRFPQAYQNYQNASTISLISPLKGSLKRGSEEHFSIKTNAYSSFVIVTAEEKYEFIPKNSKTGAFELDFKIPEDAEKLELYSSKDGKQFATIISYQLEQQN
ncbi:MAG: hypothetical protein IJ257_00600 [Treponema sp.]|nr:hypothetical protein [Treponema sp.]